MTLVVAKKLRDTIIVVADTKLSTNDGARWNNADQSNKIVCIGDQWAIAFAGNTYFADELLKGISADIGFSTLKEMMLNAHLTSLDHESTDFLLVSVKGMSIYVFAKGKCTKLFGSTAWIGDAAAFSVFQAKFLPMRDRKQTKNEEITFAPGTRGIRASIVDSEVDRLETCMTASIMDAIRNPKIDSVGGVPITLVIGNDRQYFWPEVSGLFSSPNPPIAPSDQRDVLFGEARTGDFNYETVAPTEPSSNVLAVFFRNADFALLFARWDNGIPYGRLIRNVTSDTLEARIADEWPGQMWRVRIVKKNNTYEIRADGPKAAHKLMQMPA